MSDRARLRELIAVPAYARRLFPRGGFEGLEGNTLQVLIAIEVLDKPTVNEIVAELALAQGTVSTALRVLRDAGLSSTAPDTADRRRERQGVTARGRRVIDRFQSAIQTGADASDVNTKT